MASKITGVIPSQQFELIRDRIALVLFEELAKQYTLTTDERLNVKVFLERAIAIDKTEMPCINVLLNSGIYSNKSTVTTDGEYSFSIDVYSKEKSTTTVSGDTLASLSLQKLMGVCRAILANPVYRVLGFDTKLIKGTEVEGLSIKEPTDNNDSTMSIMGRLNFKVIVVETTQLINAVPITGQETTATINLSDSGYLYQ
jgi:hypothetical protein